MVYRVDPLAGDHAVANGTGCHSWNTRAQVRTMVSKAYTQDFKLGFLMLPLPNINIYS